MSDIKEFEGIGLFERTFAQQINPVNGKIQELDFLFRKKFGTGEDEWPVEPDRYRLIWMPGCPYSNKAVITWKLLGLNRVISLGTTGILRSPKGWVFSEDPDERDPVLGVHYLHDIYTRSYPDYTGRSTVPTIADEHAGVAVNNDPLMIPTYFATAWRPYHKEHAPELYPEELAEQIEEANAWITAKINAYKCGFARSQEQYDHGYESYFTAMEQLDGYLENRRFLFGDYITLADIHLYVCLVRFYMVYNLIFKANKKRLTDYRNLWGYARDLYQTEGFREYTRFDQIKKHYQLSPHLRALFGNEYGIYAEGPEIWPWEQPHGREQLSGGKEKFRYQKETREQFQHRDPEWEQTYIEQYLHQPIERAGQATNQGEYERWYHAVFDELDTLDRLLGQRRYLLGDRIGQADIRLYQELQRFDYIYYYAYKLNKRKIEEYSNLERYRKELQGIPEVAGQIQIGQERDAYYRQQDAIRNPYHIVPRGPEPDSEK